MNQVATVNDPGALIESVIVKGDLERLSPEQRTQFYVRVCESVKLNPLTKPFEYIKLNGKLTLYAKKDATDQLRQIHNISVTDLTESERDGVLVVTAKVQNGEGRTDISKGAVALGNASGDTLANLIMKCETKAKRRATLSICGLGILDETELETIPDAAKGNGPPPRRTMAEISANKKRREDECAAVQKDLSQIETLSELERYQAEHLTPAFMSSLGNAQWAVEEWLEARRAELTAPAEEEPPPETTEERLEDKAEYIRRCHSIIDETTTEKQLLDWWNNKEQKGARRQHLLSKEEVQDLMARTMVRRQEILKAIQAAADPILEAGG